MKKGISSLCFPADWSLERSMALAKEMGFAGLEIMLSENGPVSLSSTERQLTKLRQQAEAAGLELLGLTTDLYWEANPVSAYGSVRRKAAEILARQIECASALGLEAVFLLPGIVGSDFVAGSEAVPYEQAYDRAQQFIGAGLKAARARGISLCIENAWSKFLITPLEMRRFVDSFQGERVGSCLDVGTALLGGYPQHWVDILGARLHRVQCTDLKSTLGPVNGFCDLLSGDVDWPEVVAALRRIEYAGWVTTKIPPARGCHGHCEATLISNVARTMDAIFALPA